MTTALAPTTVGALLTDHLCIVVTCVGCGQEFEDSDTESTVHFQSIPEALTILARWAWAVTDEGPLCWHCTEDATNVGGHVNALEILEVCAYCWPPLFPAATVPSKCQCSEASITHIVRAPRISLQQRGFTPKACVSFHCSDCSQPFEDYGSELHLDSLEEARRRARQNGWTITGTAIRCHLCRLRRICARRGHLFAAGGRSCHRCLELPGDPAVIV